MNNQRAVLLDALRVTLALLVFMFHSKMHFQCSYGFFDVFVSVGAMAMTGFFLLSGYVLRLVYGEMDLMEKKALGGFYLKRFLSIMPLYYTFALLYLVFLGKETWAENLLLLPVETFGLQSTFTSLFGVTHNHGTWFVSCLLLGYFIYPFLQVLVKQQTTKRKVLMIVLLIAIELWATIIRRRFHTYPIYDNPFYRLLEFSIGVLVADINLGVSGKIMDVMRSWTLLIVMSVMGVAGVFLLLYLFDFDLQDYMLLNWIVLPCLVVMLFALGSRSVGWLERSKLLSYASKISYAFFLSQLFVWPIGKWFIKQIGYDDNWIRVLIAFSICLVISMLMYGIIQKRIVGMIRSKCKV